MRQMTPRIQRTTPLQTAAAIRKSTAATTRPSPMRLGAMAVRFDGVGPFPPLSSRRLLGCGRVLPAPVRHPESHDPPDDHDQPDDDPDEVQEVGEQEPGDDEAESDDVDGPVFHGPIFTASLRFLPPPFPGSPSPIRGARGRTPRGRGRDARARAPRTSAPAPAPCPPGRPGTRSP